jgi:peptide/nickel transport system permease protein
MASSTRASSTADAVRAASSRSLGGDAAFMFGVGTLTVFVLLALIAPVVTPGDPGRLGSTPFAAPGRDYLLGTDDMGRDLFAALLHGARTSLTVGLAAAVASTILGIAIGANAGFFGGWIDDVLMRFTDLFMVLPRFLLALVMVAYFGPSLLNVIVVLAVLSFPMAARLVRGQFLSLRELDFVQAAHALGASPWRVIARHMLPNAAGALLIAGSFQAAAAILSEAGLSFLGLSDPAVMTWGRMLNNAQPFLRRAWWMGVFPGCAIFLTVIALNVIGDRLETAFSPRRKTA